MSAQEQAHERALTLLARAESGLRMTRELESVNEATKRIAEAIANGTVALLSLLPRVGTDPVALGFTSDAMQACAAAMTELLGLQGALGEVIAEEEARARGSAAEAHSVRAELLGEA